MERSTWAWMPAGALLLFGVGPTLCAAQPPGPVSTPPSVVVPEPSQRGWQLPPTTPAPTPPAATGDAATIPRSPLETEVTLPPPTPMPTDVRFPINLATALRLSDARPLIVAAAQASVWVAEAELTRAKVLWVPTLNIGFDYIRHDGGGPDFNKGILTAVSTNFFYAGAGLTGTPFGIISTTDAIYQPLVARQVLNARHWDVQSAKNDALIRTADAYFLVHQQRGMYAGTLYCVERGHELVERIATMSRDLVPQVEVDRARNMLADLEQRAVSARQQWRVQQRRPHAGPPARPPLRGRAAGARPSPDHPDRPRPPARRPDADRPDQPARARLAAGAGPGGGGGDPPGEGAPVPPQRRAQRLPDPLRAAPGRDLRLRRQHQHEPVDGPRRLQHPAPLAAPESRAREPRA